MPPILVAAIPITDKMKAPQLHRLLQQVVLGLLNQNIKVISYSCDGTEVERAVQKLFVEAADERILVELPHGVYIEIAVVRGQLIVMIQDSKHGLKTFRNNLFSGARLLVLGNYPAYFEHIHALAYDDGTPLYRRDVERIDRQDDNAASRLFSGVTLDFIVKQHPDQLGVIVYLFVFGELIDAYQNRHINHAERVVMVLRAQYFVDMWLNFTLKAGYAKARYFMSRESVEIIRFLVDDLISLIVVHRDHLPTDSAPIPLLPWLHSSEVCEHVFGLSRQIIMDFTMVDLLHMVPKLKVQIQSVKPGDYGLRIYGLVCSIYLNPLTTDWSGQIWPDLASRLATSGSPFIKVSSDARGSIIPSPIDCQSVQMNVRGLAIDQRGTIGWAIGQVLIIC